MTGERESVFVFELSFDDWMHIHTTGCIYTRLDAYTHDWMHIHTTGCIYTRLDAYTHDWMHKHTTGCIYTRLDAYTHDWMHIHTTGCILCNCRTMGNLGSGLVNHVQ